jgi:hypothetical protein
MTKATDQYEELIKLLAVFTEAENRINAAQNAANEALLEAVDDAKSEFAQAQKARDEAEAAVKLLSQRHPEWLDGRTIKTPYGTVRFTRTTSLEVPDEDVTVTLIKATRSAEELATFIRTKEVPNKQALELCTDDELKKLGVCRVVTDSIKVSAAKVDLGKAGKTSTTKEKGKA